MKKTKIICTIGPASSSRATITKMIKNGMNVARLNFSHGTYEDHQEKIDLIKQVRHDLGEPVAIMLDTKGPEYRIGKFKEGRATLRAGNTFVLTSKDIPSTAFTVLTSFLNNPFLVTNSLFMFSTQITRFILLLLYKII